MTLAEKAPRTFSDTSREKMAGRGVAMPDGSYPIPDKDALRRAIASYGRAKDPEAVKRHIIKRAKALGATDLLPAEWGGAPAKGSMAAQHSAQASDILEDLYELIDCESDEPAHVAMLQQAASIVLRFLGEEHAEIGRPGDDAPMANGKARIVSKVWADELKAEPMDGRRLERWLSGDIPRRILVLPFGGPLPGGKAGLDLDGEYFDAETDIYGPYPALRRTRERLVDWHHDNDPTGVMKGAVLGRIVMDENPEDEGVWADFWANAGEQRRALIARLEKAGVPLYGSSQAIRGAVRKASDGHIELWPLVRHTITTSPQNTYAVVPTIKSVLAADIPSDALTMAAVKAALVESDAPPTLGGTLADGGSSFRQSGKRSGKAGRVLSRKNEALVAEIAERAERLLVQLRKLQAQPDSTGDTTSG